MRHDHQKGPATVRARRAGAGFTLVELLFVLAIIFLIMALLLGGIKHVMGFARSTADGATIASLKNGVTQFTQTVSFEPPLVMDLGPPPTFTGGPLVSVNNELRPQVYSAAQAGFLRTAAPGGPNLTAPNSGDMRFSIYSMPYYILGVLDLPRSATNTTAIDGLPGPGFRAPKRDGSFETTGRTLGPYFDVAKNAKAVVESSPVGQGRIELHDAHEIAIRYYRWIRGDQNEQIANVLQLNVPWILGASPLDLDPASPATAKVPEELRSATWAILGAGPNGLFGDEFLLPSNHPQYKDRPTYDLKLGGKAPASDAERAQRGMADNILGVPQ